MEILIFILVYLGGSLISYLVSKYHFLKEFGDMDEEDKWYFVMMAVSSWCGVIAMIIVILFFTKHWK